jgi:hypothetical protein
MDGRMVELVEIRASKNPPLSHPVEVRESTISHECIDEMIDSSGEVLTGKFNGAAPGGPS